MSQIIHLSQARPKAMLERLKRLTGLEFETFPESLLDAGPVTGGDPAGQCGDEPDYPSGGQKKAGPEGRRQAHGQQTRQEPGRHRV